MDQAFRDAMAAGYALDRAGGRDRQPDARGRALQRRPRRGRAVDAQPPRPHRRRHRHRQDEDAPAPGRPALEGRRPGLRRRHQGRPDRPRGPRRRRQPQGHGALRIARLDLRADRPSGRVPVAVGQARRARSARRSTRSGRCCSARSSTSTRPRRRSSRSSSSTATTTTCRCSTSTDLATTLKFLSSDEGKPILADYGGMSPASVGVLLRSIVVLEQEGADVFFGEPEFDVEDLLRTTPDGQGIISVLELSDVMDKPRLFSTFMLWMLAQLYEALPEAGDLPKPKLCFFFDEAHLLFDDASEALMDQVERTARLIRSKGVGVYFVTQAPTDVPVVGPGPARQPRPARAAGLHARRRRRPAQDRPDLPDDRLLRRRARRSPRSASARRWSRSSRPAACRRRSRRPGCCRPIRSWPPWIPPRSRSSAAGSHPRGRSYGRRRSRERPRDHHARGSRRPGRPPPTPRSARGCRRRRPAA